MPSYSAIYKTMRSLAEQEAAVTKAHGRDPTKWGIIRLDNVQQYIRQRDMRIGCENKMQIGIAATYFENEGFVPGAADLDDKRRRISENKRKYLTIDQLVGSIDHEHLETLHIVRIIGQVLFENAATKGVVFRRTEYKGFRCLLGCLGCVHFGGDAPLAKISGG